MGVSISQNPDPTVPQPPKLTAYEWILAIHSFLFIRRIYIYKSCSCLKVTYLSRIQPMPFELHFQYLPVCSMTPRTGSTTFQDYKLGITNTYNIENVVWSIKHDISLGQAALMPFKSIVE